MPQVILTFSKNIDINEMNLERFFIELHKVLSTAPSMDVTTVHSGVIQEQYSYIGLGNSKATRVYLQLYWMESPVRAAMKATLGQQLMHLLEEYLAPDVRKQGLLCIPRVRIAHLGELNQSYFIGAS